MLKEAIDLNETLLGTIDLLYEIVEYNNIWIHMLKEAIDLNETLVGNYWFVIWDCGI